VYRCPCEVCQATCAEGDLVIASKSGLEGDRVTDRPSTRDRPRGIWHVQRVSCDDGRLDPAWCWCLWECASNRRCFIWTNQLGLGLTTALV